MVLAGRCVLWLIPIKCKHQYGILPTITDVIVGKNPRDNSKIHNNESRPDAAILIHEMRTVLSWIVLPSPLLSARITPTS